MDWLIGILIWLAIGALIGWIAGLIMKSKNSLLGNIVFGIVGSFLGGVIAQILSIGGGWWVVIAIGGACLLIFAMRWLKKK